MASSNPGLRGKLLIFSVASFLALALGEITVRILRINENYTRRGTCQNLFIPTDIPNLLYVPKPNGYSTVDGVVNQFNADGFRDRTYPRAKAEGVTRIVVLGDSVTYGLGVAADQAYPKVVERSLHELSTRRWEVLNFGIPGYATPQELIYYRQAAQWFQPDVILIGYCMNDIICSSRELPYIMDLKQQARRRPSFIEKLADHSELAYMLRYQVLQNQVKNYIRQQSNDYQAAYGYMNLYHQENYWGQFLANLDDLKALAEEDNVQVVFVLIPLLTELASYPWSDVDMRIRAAVIERNLHFIYLLDTLSMHKDLKLRRYPNDYEHLSDYGHKIVGEVIAGYLLSWFPDRSAALTMRPAVN